ncbi:hypothetical protein Anas_13163 [Armadillidium nasatum]|uniref:Uncharacterized protein n=1 Tax=Armadillidium nasatum TaxID=96803 RepID=A0A5N5SQ54_9CRUS|nr:hypothetical protein Anas_13163 [Armadillidium nasatum]
MTTKFIQRINFLLSEMGIDPLNCIATLYSHSLTNSRIIWGNILFRTLPIGKSTFTCTESKVLSRNTIKILITRTKLKLYGRKRLEPADVTKLQDISILSIFKLLTFSY